jgi:starch synthase
MRVGLMTREYPPYVYGGAGVHVEYLSRELAKTIEVEVHAWGAEPDAAKQPAPVENLEVHFDQPWDAISNGTDAKFKGALEALSLNLFQNLKLDKLDVIHTHTWYVSMAGFLAKKLYNIPFVLTTHSLEPLRAWKAEQLGSGYALSSWMERTAILEADAIVAVSNGTKADIIKAYPDVDESRIHVIYNGIDLNQYQYTESTDALTKYGVDPSKPYVLFVGRITRQKGVTHLVEAIPHLPPGTQVVLCAGAPDTPEIAEEMRSKVAKLTKVDLSAALHDETPEPGTKPPASTVDSDEVNNPPGHAASTGDPSGKGHNVVWIEQMVSKEEAIELYSHCAVFCCPSVYEPFGIINLEAMACKAPVVASATGGILEVVVEGDTGHLVTFDADEVTTFPKNPEKFSKDLAARITELLKDPAKAKAMGEAGRKRVEDHFSWTAIAAQTVDLYKSLIKK